MLKGMVDDALRVSFSQLTFHVLSTHNHVRRPKAEVLKQFLRCVEVVKSDFWVNHEYLNRFLADPPRGEEEWIPVDPNFTHGVDLVSYIRSSSEFSSYFCIGVAGRLIHLHVVPPLLTYIYILGYPDGHDKDTAEDVELNYLKAKVDAGADFIMTQLFYDVDSFLQWVKKVRAKG